MSTPSCWWLDCCSEVEGQRPRPVALLPPPVLLLPDSTSSRGGRDFFRAFLVLCDQKPVLQHFPRLMIDFCPSSISNYGSKNQRCEVTKYKYWGRFSRYLCFTWGFIFNGDVLLFWLPTLTHTCQYFLFLTLEKRAGYCCLLKVCWK